MKGKILDIFSESSNSKCYLTGVDLQEYINSLSSDYDRYEIQRDIVSNVYLDTMVNTIFEKKHIPPIVLVVQDDDTAERSKNEIEIKHFKILDGLQRTFRLKTIYDTIEFIKNLGIPTAELVKSSKLEISKQFKSDLIAINSSTSLFYSALTLIERTPYISIDNVFDLFRRIQWFEIWRGLTPKDEINKMLVLNAGHKAVSTKHQLELLFSNLLPTLKKLTEKQFTVVRDKEKPSIEYSKGRQESEFHFSHLITALLSFSEGKPLTANIDLIQKSQGEYFDEESLRSYFDADFLNEFMSSLVDLDHSIVKTYNDTGLRWLGREVSLVGIFAALGRKMKEDKLSTKETFLSLRTKVIDQPEALNILNFEELRNTMILSKVNIGSVNKKAIFNGIYDLLNVGGNTISWSKYFKAESHA